MDERPGGRGGVHRRVMVAVADELLRDALAVSLHGKSMDVEGVSHQELLRRLTAARDCADLAIVDSNGSAPGDWAIVHRIRGVSDVNLLVLASSGELQERLDALRAGADAVLSKPFSLSELLVNVAAMLRRSSPPSAGRIACADLVLDEDEHIVTRRGQELRLTALEFNLLQTFCLNQRRVLSKTQLLSIVWGFEEFDPNVVEVHVSALRKKMEAAGPRILHTVRGVGYVLRPEPADVEVPA